MAIDHSTSRPTCRRDFRDRHVSTDPNLGERERSRISPCPSNFFAGLVFLECARHCRRLGTVWRAPSRRGRSPDRSRSSPWRFPVWYRGGRGRSDRGGLGGEGQVARIASGEFSGSKLRKASICSLVTGKNGYGEKYYYYYILYYMEKFWKLANQTPSSWIEQVVRAIHDFGNVRKWKRIPALRDPYGWRSSGQKEWII